MAKFELKILDFFNIQKVEIKKDKYYTDIIKLEFTDLDGGFLHRFLMDKSTAIKFAKTLRTEINKIQD